MSIAIQAEDLGSSLSRTDQVQKNADGSGFPGTIGTKEAEYFTGLDLQIKVLYSTYFTIVFCQPKGPDNIQEAAPDLPVWLL